MPDNPSTRAADGPARVAHQTTAGRPTDRYHPSVAAFERERPALDARQQVYLDRSVPLDGGRSYLGNDEWLGDLSATVNDSLVNGARLDGWYKLVVHGTKDSADMPDGNDGWERLTPAEFAPLVLHDPTWNGTDAVVLLACHTGQGFAQDLYSELGGEVSILAPLEYGLIYGTGEVSAGRMNGLDARGNPIYEADPSLWVYLERHAPPGAPPKPPPPFPPVVASARPGSG